jgi:alpha-tubulin suppressor-like RCC1 family protein
MLLAACEHECGGLKGPACVDTSPSPTWTDTGPPAHPGYSSEGGWTEVSTGWWHTCGVNADGAVQCWGWNGNGETDVPNGTLAFTGLSAGWYTTCALYSGRRYCWGYVDPASSDSDRTDARTVAVGAATVCTLHVDGALYCEPLWGDQDQYGQSEVPDGSFTDVSTGEYHTCAVDSDGAVVCWGAGKGEGGTYDFGQSTPPTGTFVRVSAGDWHTCALTSDGSIACWGDGSAGQTTPPDGVFTQVSAGHWHTCAVDVSGAIVCWGDNSVGQCSPPDGTFTSVTAGGDHTCALDTDGVIHCWGDDYDGECTPP